MSAVHEAVAHEEWRREIEAVDAARIAALIQADQEALEGFLSDDLIYVHSSGRDETKDLYVQRVVKAEYDYRSFVATTRELHRAGDFVFDNGVAEIDIVVGGNFRQIASRYLIVWRHESGCWRMFRFHASPVARQAAGA